MDEQTLRLALPLLAAGQAQKEVLHNEALAALDLAIGAVAVTIGDDVPPDNPDEGACWIVGDHPTGAWAGHAGALAGWTGAGWRFVPPAEGMAVWVRSLDGLARRTVSGWTRGEIDATLLRIGGVQVVGPRQPAIPSPAGGATIDAEARAALQTVLSALQSHGLIAP